MNDRLDRLLKHLQAFVAFARKQSKDDDLAVDAVQDALLRAISRVDQIRDDEKLLAWFYRVLRNTITDLQRQRSRERSVTGAALPEDEAALAPDDHGAVCACLDRLVDALKSDHREVVRAVDLGGGDASAVAERLGITVNNLHVRRHRARRDLESALRATCRLCAEHGCLDCDCGS